MEDLATASPAEQHLLANAFDLERQLRSAERHYADAREAADRARDEWRSLSIRQDARPTQVLAARAKFEAVAARCNRLRSMIEQLEERLDD